MNTFVQQSVELGSNISLLAQSDPIDQDAINNEFIDMLKALAEFTLSVDVTVSISSDPDYPEESTVSVITSTALLSSCVVFATNATTWNRTSQTRLLKFLWTFSTSQEIS